MGSPFIGYPPIGTSPVRTPKGDGESEDENAEGKRSGLVRGLGKGTLGKDTLKGLKKGKEKGK